MEREVRDNDKRLRSQLTKNPVGDKSLQQRKGKESKHACGGNWQQEIAVAIKFPNNRNEDNIGKKKTGAGGKNSQNSRKERRRPMDFVARVEIRKNKSLVFKKKKAKGIHAKQHETVGKGEGKMDIGKTKGKKKAFHRKESLKKGRRFILITGKETSEGKQVAILRKTQ